MKNNLPIKKKVTAVLIITFSVLALLIFLSIPVLAPLWVLAFTPCLLLFNHSRRWLVSAGSLAIIILVWLGLMIGMNGADSVKTNLTQGFEHFKEFIKE
ncbi:hypothetical protein [Paenibacillus glufosinatiresistens]|uniref:hypothetical protein n=1 Tax=Paenibacillus glufosinatiresistens TaxID=3070657 RepID=UPI00286E8268|nr:hypothetical protein [Paenibacillus sp. YX.27]